MYDSILKFWFEELEPKDWWKKDSDFDQLILDRFGKVHTQATQGELFEWRKTAKGSLAEVIVLDQFSRNIFRDKPGSFQYDPMALTLSQIAIEKGFDQELSPDERVFLYMPFMHSESALIHEEAVKLYTQLGIQNNLDFEIKHKTIIDRFGRYPHRNKILGRESTEEEITFLSQPGSSF